MSKLSFALLLVTALLLNTAQANMVRVVVSVEGSNNLQINAQVQSSVQSKCLTSLDGAREFCFPIKMLQPSVQSATTTNQLHSKRFYTLAFDADSSQQLIDTLKTSQWFASVELDVVITTGKPKKAHYVVGSQSLDHSLPNDPNYSQQVYLQDEASLSQSNVLSYSNITLANERVNNKATRVGIAVLDSAFAENSELSFAGGYSFTTYQDEQRNVNYLIGEEQIRTDCSMHGYGVAGVIGAKINDGKTIAGVVNNVDLYALRVLNCNNGYLSDAADSLAWISGEHFDGIPDFTGRVSVANLSLGGRSSRCPSYMQEAIDKANAAGISVVVAAGNETINATNFTPANCQNIVVVGAIEPEGGRSNYSNFGNSLNISAQGTNILSFGSEEGVVYLWEGTSFAAPLVSGAIALAKKDAPSLTPKNITTLLELSSKSIADTNGQCETNGCGKGLLDAEAFVEMAQLAEVGELNTIKHALADSDDCDANWMVEHFGDKTRLCGMFQVSFLGGLAQSNKEFQFYRVAKGEDFLTAGEHLLTTSKSKLLVGDINTQLYDYSFKICSDGTCTQGFNALNTDGVDHSVPSACKN